MIVVITRTDRSVISYYYKLFVIVMHLEATEVTELRVNKRWYRRENGVRDGMCISLLLP